VRENVLQALAHEVALIARRASVDSNDQGVRVDLESREEIAAVALYSVAKGEAIVSEIEDQEPIAAPPSHAEPLGIVRPLVGDLDRGRSRAQDAHHDVQLRRGLRVVRSAGSRCLRQRIVESDDRRIGHDEILDPRQATPEHLRRGCSLFDHVGQDRLQGLRPRGGESIVEHRGHERVAGARLVGSPHAGDLPPAPGSKSQEQRPEELGGVDLTPTFHEPCLPSHPRKLLVADEVFQVEPDPYRLLMGYSSLLSEPVAKAPRGAQIQGCARGADDHAWILWRR